MQTWPSIIQVKVCKPMCGCGPTRMPAPAAKRAGPAWSRKHHAPTVRRVGAGAARARSKALHPGRRGEPRCAARRPFQCSLLATAVHVLPCALPIAVIVAVVKSAFGPRMISAESALAVSRSAVAPVEHHAQTVRPHVTQLGRRRRRSGMWLARRAARSRAVKSWNTTDDTLVARERAVGPVLDDRQVVLDRLECRHGGRATRRGRCDQLITLAVAIERDARGPRPLAQTESSRSMVAIPLCHG